MRKLTLGFSHLKLKSQLLLIVTLTGVLLISLQAVYWMSFYSLTKDRAGEYEQKIIGQTFDRMDSFMLEIRKNADTIVKDRKLQEFVSAEDDYHRDIELGPFILDLMDYARSFNSAVHSILIEGFDGRQVNNLALNDSNFYNSEGFRRFMEPYQSAAADFRRPKFTGVFHDEDSHIDYVFYLCPVIESVGGVHFAEKIGVVAFAIRVSAFQAMVSNSELTPHSLFAIVDNSGRIVASSARGHEGERISDVIREDGLEAGNGAQELISGERVMIQEKALTQAQGWKIVSAVPVNELTEDMSVIQRIGMISVVGILLIMVALGVVFFMNLTRPVTALVQDVRQMGNRRHRHRAVVESSNEVGILAVEINQMMDRMDDMTRNIFENQSRMYELELSQRRAEFSALERQINPHFLYNTLHCISSIGLACGNREIARIASAMSLIFRYAVREADLVTVEDEIACVEAYLSIISIRYGNRFTIDTRFDPSVKKYSTPKMILQPIVENAVYHGLEPRSGGGALTVTADVQEGMLHFCVRDTGAGIPQETLDAMRQRLAAAPADHGGQRDKGIGLLNIHRRIRLLFGSPFGIRIHSRLSEYTEVEVLIPLQEADKTDSEDMA